MRRITTHTYNYKHTNKQMCIEYSATKNSLEKCILVVWLNCWTCIIKTIRLECTFQMKINERKKKIELIIIDDKKFVCFHFPTTQIFEQQRQRAVAVPTEARNHNVRVWCARSWACACVCSVVGCVSVRTTQSRAHVSRAPLWWPSGTRDRQWKVFLCTFVCPWVG